MKAVLKIIHTIFQNFDMSFSHSEVPISSDF
jgi:hypothetical protein